MKKQGFRQYTEEWIELYNNGLSFPKIAKKYGCHFDTVRYHISDKVQIRSSSERNRKYSLNQNYFENIDTQEKAYWLGLISADGSVFKEEYSYKMNITLHQDDKDHLETFKNLIGTDRPLSESEDNCIRIVLNSKKIYNDLNKHGIKPNKSLTNFFPIGLIKKEFHKSFILGYFDGDGCVYHSDIHSAEFSMVGTYEFLEVVQEILMKELNLNKVKIAPDGNVFVLAYGGNQQVEKIGKWLYNNQKLFLKRKNDKFKELYEVNLKRKVLKEEKKNIIKATHINEVIFEKTAKRGDCLFARVPNHPNATKNGYVLMHRFVMEQHLQRFLREVEVVRHINKDKFDNRIENLTLMDIKEFKKENKGRTYHKLKCPNCNSIFNKEKRQVRKTKLGATFCGRSCAGTFSSLIQHSGGITFDLQKLLDKNFIEEFVK